MHTASESTRRSGNMTRWFITCVYILRFVHQARRDLNGAKTTLAVFPLYTVSSILRRANRDAPGVHRASAVVVLVRVLS